MSAWSTQPLLAVGEHALLEPDCLACPAGVPQSEGEPNARLGRHGGVGIRFSLEVGKLALEAEDLVLRRLGSKRAVVRRRMRAPGLDERRIYAVGDV